MTIIPEQGEAMNSQSVANLAAAKNLVCFMYGSINRQNRTQDEFWESLPEEVRSDCLALVEKYPPVVGQPTWAQFKFETK